MTKKSDEDSIHPSETAYDKAIKRMEEREACILNTPTMQVTASVAEQIRVQQAPLIQALQPLQDAIQPYHNLMEQNSLGLAAATASLSSVAQTLVPDDAMSSMTGTLNAVATAIDEHFGNADAVPQPPERCLSRQAGIVRLPQAVRKTAIPKT